MVIASLYERQWSRDLQYVRVVLGYDPQNGLTRVRLERILVDFGLSDAELGWSEASATPGQLTVQTKLARVHLYELLAELADVPGVQSLVRERIDPVHAA
jgi:hypothetical protein